jgi:hypothetical protein
MTNVRPQFAVTYTIVMDQATFEAMAKDDAALRERALAAEARVRDLEETVGELLMLSEFAAVERVLLYLGYLPVTDKPGFWWRPAEPGERLNLGDVFPA